MAQESSSCGQFGKQLMDPFLRLYNAEIMIDQKGGDLKVKLKASHLGPDQGAQERRRGRAHQDCGAGQEKKTDLKLIVKDFTSI